MTTADEEYPSIPAMALASAERFGDAVAVIEGDVELSFSEVADEMLAVARGLVALGIEAGDRVAVWAPNSARWITSALGVLASGAWLVPVNTRFKGSEAAQVLRTAGAAAVLCVNGFLGADPIGMLRESAPGLVALERAVVMDGPTPPGAHSWAGFLAAGQSVSEAEIRDRIAAIGPGDVSDVIFTSGTTGRPKGVILRHGASLRLYRLVNDGWVIGPGDRALVVMPFFHCFGYKFGWMLSLMCGATTVPMAVFEPEGALRAVERYGITHIGGSPTLHAAFMDEQARVKADLETLRVATVSAAYIPVARVHRMREERGLDHVMAGYGLTEAHATVSITHIPRRPTRGGGELVGPAAAGRGGPAGRRGRSRRGPGRAGRGSGPGLQPGRRLLRRSRCDRRSVPPGRLAAHRGHRLHERGWLHHDL